MRMHKSITKQAKRRRGVSLWMICVMAAWPGLIISGCGSNDFLGLEDYQRDLLVGFGALAIALLSDGQGDGTGPPIGQPQPATDGLSCWDTNGNLLAEPEEDVNGDGVFDALDCRGAVGLSCWDINGNGAADASEDINGDGFFTVADCGGSGGGLSCWDTNGNGFADPQEDVNGDGSFDAVDCQGPRGSSGGGSAGASGADGIDGLQCWDLNGDGIGQPEEDVTRARLDARHTPGACATKASRRLVTLVRPPVRRCRP